MAQQNIKETFQPKKKRKDMIEVCWALIELLHFSNTVENRLLKKLSC
uniref:Uncharacterized protein n=1 Tax=Anguilla anguilla TaxID=7936 RepID=A0A0E9SYX6_ANGAN